MNIQSVSIIRSMGGLVFDAVFEETHESELEITDDPVETGVSVSDHAYMLPLKLTISAGVSDTSLVGWASTGGQGKDYWKRDMPSDPFASDVESRSVMAFKLLKELQALGEPFDVQTGLMLYKNMVCKRLRSSQDKDSSNALMLTAELREVNIVDTQIVQYPPRKSGSTARQAGAKKDLGNQNGTEVTSPVKKQSLLSKLKTALGR